MRIYMQIPAFDAKAPRFYQLLLEQDLLGGWILIKEWGNQGSSGRVKCELFDSYDQAQAALMNTRDVQIDRGYKVVFVQGSQRE